MTPDTPVYVSRDRSFPAKLSRAVNDLVTGFAHWRIWTAFAWEDLRTTYKRSVIGFFWISISFLAFVSVKFMIFGPMLGRENDSYYTTYLLLGFFSWQHISSSVNGATSVFVSNENWIRNDNMPFSLYVYQNVTRNAIELGFTLIVAAGLFFYFHGSVPPRAYMLVPVLLIYLVSGVWTSIILGIVCARFRDLAHLIRTIMRISIYLTPIFWMPEQVGEVAEILWWNPFMHYLQILRGPFIDASFAVENWIFVLVVNAIGITVGFFLFALFRRRVVFWF